MDEGGRGQTTITDGPCGSRRVSDRVAEILLRRIAAGEFAPGQRLPGERHLAEELGVSRVSVRSALQVLKARGLIDAVQGGGTRVVATTEAIDPGITELVRVDSQNLYDLAEIRLVLETWAARRAALHATEEHLAEMTEALAAGEAEARLGRLGLGSDVAFHMALARATRSGIYLHLAGVVRNVIHRMVQFHLRHLARTPEDQRTIVIQHRAILNAVRGRDPDAAARAMERHLSWVLEKYRRGGQQGD